MIISEKIIVEGFEGTVSRDTAVVGPRPGVLVAHAFGGQAAFDTDKAEELARLGYVAIAIDMYGQGRRAGSPVEAAALMHELTDNRPIVAQRMQMWLAVLAGLPDVDAARLGAIGFCFGGKCVLDLARIGADLRGVVSFHGVLDAPEGTATGPMPASVLVLHGWDDPLATPTQFCELGAELSARGADWQMMAYGDTGHAFTNPAAQAPDQGMMFNPRTNARAWAAMAAFFEEQFQGKA
ncbi:MAG: dienelactone hydrolase family protein [Marinosulfonomonas sp.]|nr:dienelactone hydrolase family protein [Marinosulfonomonas sp.]